MIEATPLCVNCRDPWSLCRCEYPARTYDDLVKLLKAKIAAPVTVQKIEEAIEHMTVTELVEFIFSISARFDVPNPLDSTISKETK